MVRIVSLLAVILIVAAAVGLYRFKGESQQLVRQIAELRTQIDDEREAISVLKAEWNYLDQPSRIQELADRYLDLTRLDVEQISVVEQLPMRPLDFDPSGANNTIGGFAGGEDRTVQ
jgi:cell division protein FtsL